MITALVLVAVFLFGTLAPVILFCGWLVKATNDPKSMRDFAVVLRAIPRPGFTIHVTRRERAKGS